MRSPSFVANSRVPSAFGVVMAPARGAKVRPSGQTYALSSSLDNCGTAADGSHYVIDSSGNQVPLPAGALGCDSNGNPIDASGHIMSIPLATPTTNWSNCGTAANGTRYVFDANGNQVPVPAGAVGCNSSGQPIDASGNVLSVPLASVASPAAVTPQNQALYNTIGSALGTTGQAISSAIAANNQMQLAQLQSATQLQIAQLQVGVQQANAQGNLALAQQRLAQLGPLQQFQAQLQASQTQTTTLYVLGAIVALGIIGAVVYFRPTGTSQAGPAPRSSRASRSATARNNPIHVLTRPVHAVRSLRRRSA